MLGRLEMDVDQCIQAYVNLMSKVFEKKVHKFPITLGGEVQSRFDSEVLKDAVNEVITSCGFSPDDPFDDGVQRGCKV